MSIMERKLMVVFVKTNLITMSKPKFVNKVKDVKVNMWLNLELLLGVLKIVSLLII